MPTGCSHCGSQGSGVVSSCTSMRLRSWRCELGRSVARRPHYARHWPPGGPKSTPYVANCWLDVGLGAVWFWVGAGESGGDVGRRCRGARSVPGPPGPTSRLRALPRPVGRGPVHRCHRDHRLGDGLHQWVVARRSPDDRGGSGTGVGLRAYAALQRRQHVALHPDHAGVVAVRRFGGLAPPPLGRVRRRLCARHVPGRPSGRGSPSRPHDGGPPVRIGAVAAVFPGGQVVRAVHAARRRLLAGSTPLPRRRVPPEVVRPARRALVLRPHHRHRVRGRSAPLARVCSRVADCRPRRGAGDRARRTAAVRRAPSASRDAGLDPTRQRGPARAGTGLHRRCVRRSPAVAGPSPLGRRGRAGRSRGGDTATARIWYRSSGLRCRSSV